MTIDETEKIRKVVENKDYIAQLVNAVAKTMLEAFENLKIEDVNMYQLGYSKAIDDFAKLVEIWCWKHEQYNQDDLNTLMNIAERLKAGVKYEM